jgi:acetylornithine deacetylase/succinyl-diaminopimelate desuccinylase-like protein
MDKVGNIYGTRRGTGNEPQILVEAHLDTVFPESTDVLPVEKNGKIFAPGISDDACGLSAILSVVRAFNTSCIKTVGDIIFCGTVGHEGIGNLLGIKTVYSDNPNITATVHLESENGIVYLATGSRRYEVIFKGPGGHSWSEFGIPSAIHAMSRAIAEIADIKTVQNPKTTFTVGMVKGGTSVNSIAANASLQLDMRSNSEVELLKLETTILPLFQKAANSENARWKHRMEITVECKKIGDRPAGSQSANAKIVQATIMAYKVLKLTPIILGSCSTNANISINLGIPAVVVGGIENSGDAHTLVEWIETKNAYYAPQKLFLTILGLAGIDKIVTPLIDT